jgi:hypothetical protein
MKKLLSFLIVLVLFASCNKDLAEKPKNLIEKEKMVDVIYDLTVLSAMRSQNTVMIDSFKNSSNAYIYKKYKIDSIQFAKSNIYYAADYKEYKAMYDQVKLRLDTDKKRVELAIKTEKKKADLLEKKKKKLKETKIADSIKKAKLKMNKEIDSLKKKADVKKIQFQTK